MEVSLRLIKNGHRVTVITEQIKDEKLHKEVNGISVYKIPQTTTGWFKKFFVWKWMWQYRSHLKKADVIHCHDVFFWYLPFRFLFPRKKVFVTFHGYESYPLSKKAVMMHKIAELLSIGNICIGKFIQKWYGTKPTYVSYGGVKMANGKWQMANRMKRSAIFIGRLDDQTGITTYNAAFERLLKRHPKFQFCVIGDGVLGKSLSSKVKRKPFQANAIEYLKKYHIAFVSRYLSILEALSARRPVIAVYDNPIKKDYLIQTPFRKFIHIAKNSSDVVKQVEHILSHEDSVKKQTEDGYHWAKSQSWEKVAETYLLLWQHKK